MVVRAKNRRRTLGLGHTRRFVKQIYGMDLHALRVVSLGNGVSGVLNSAVLSVHAIGQAYAQLARTTPKSGVKQTDRMLSNEGLDLGVIMSRWVKFVVGTHKSIIVALDWTEFDRDDHSTLCAYLVTRHGRAMPLAWKTVQKSELANRRSAIEEELVAAVHGWIPTDTRVTLLADRGFGSVDFYSTLQLLGWDFVIRFRECILVEVDGEQKPAAEWLSSSGRARKLSKVRVTNDKTSVEAVVVVRGARMKEAWCLATSLAGSTAADVVKLYSRRFTIEETFRDTKDLHFGLGLKATHIRDANRRDRPLPRDPRLHIGAPWSVGCEEAAIEAVARSQRADYVWVDAQEPTER
jgi:hypothetical protein